LTRIRLQKHRGVTQKKSPKHLR
ncbi:hypothetical protein VCHENC02_3236B, partial [Vibrio harveyi]